ncbi:GNAT family N-acetyltransferase [Catenuloplanes sp. NPDC051500]|uniref:GNAT family N-acetyltransferase n=1 Tax=Catenuloplanes sp. NPDC051500 TaxID=3363959 RepID=UPI003796A5B2
MTIRPAHPDDAAALVALRLKTYPHLVRGEAATRRQLESPPPGADLAAFTALSPTSDVVGFVTARRNTATSDPAAGEISLLHVDPAHRRRGHGAGLLRAAENHLRAIGVRRVRAFVLPDGLSFATARGYTPSREARYSELDLTGLQVDPPPVPAGYTLTPISALPATALYAAEAAGAADEPGDVAPDAVSYETWRYDVWDDPGLDRAISMAVLGPSGEVVSFSLLLRDGDRAWSDMTATLPAHRGLGLARLAKSEALARAAASGITIAYTSNDAANAAMLAVNTHLGYRPTGTAFSTLTTLPPHPPP